MNPVLLVCSLAFFLCTLTVDVNAQKAGEIVFSKDMIKTSSPSGLAAAFQAGDNIYAVAFFDKAIQDMGRTAGAKKMGMEVFVYELKPPLYDYQQPSEMQLETSSLMVSGDAVQQKYLLLDIVPTAQAITAYGTPELEYKKFGSTFSGPVRFAEALAKLEPGDHTIIVRVKCNYNDVAEGKFVIKGKEFASYKKLARELNAAASESKTKAAAMPKAARTDRGLEAEMIKAFKASQTYRDRVKGDILRVVIIDPDWMVRRHPVTGIILHRYIRATIAVKNSDGSCTAWQLVTFQQDYAGNKYQPTRFDGIGDPMKIPCENVMK